MKTLDIVLLINDMLKSMDDSRRPTNLKILGSSSGKITFEVDTVTFDLGGESFEIVVKKLKK